MAVRTDDDEIVTAALRGLGHDGGRLALHQLDLDLVTSGLGLGLELGRLRLHARQHGVAHGVPGEACLAEEGRAPRARGQLPRVDHLDVNVRRGQLDAVLAWAPRPSTELAAVLDRLLTHAVVEGELMAWPVSVGAEPGGWAWASWCNGMAGHVFLWCRAYEVFREERYLEEKFGESYRHYRSTVRRYF